MELLVLAILILCNGVFAMSEMAVVSSRKARLQQFADEGRSGAAAALALANKPTIFLSTIQVGITVIGITSGAFGEATLAQGLSDRLSQWPAIDPYSDQIALGVVVAGITFASLIVGELVPKRLALVNPESVASLIARPMQMLSTITYPVVRLLSFTTEGVLALFGIRTSTEAPVTEEEINVLMAQGALAGVFERHEQAIVSRVFRLDDLRVTGVMTPRSEVVYVDLDLPLAANLRRMVEASHSRFPVARGGLDRIEGIVFAKTLLEDAVAGRPLELGSRLAKPLFVPETLTVTAVLASFKKHRQTVALVVNEYGEVQGLVSLNDIMEALVGDIATVDNESERDIVRRDDGSWLVDGFKDVVGVEEPLPEEDAGTYQTIGGFAMMRLGHVPRVSDAFEWHGLRFEVMDMDRNRVDKLLVTPKPSEGARASIGE
jgi:putative hemolysin